jgi:hypothetical protein
LAQLKIQLSVLLIFQRDTLKTCIHSDSSNRNEPSSLPPLTKSTQQSWKWSCNLEYSLWNLGIQNTKWILKKEGKIC